MGRGSVVGIQSRKGVEMYNCRTSCEHGVTMASWTRAYRFYVMKHGGVDPDEVQQGGVPILQHGQADRDTGNFEMSYNNEEREYYAATV